MAISAVSVGQRIAASILNSIINIANRVDQVVVPTSVSGTGVSVTTNGKVALAATPAASINGVFSTTYQKYRVEIDGVGSAGLSFTFVLRVGGADVTTANYDSTENLARNSAVSSATNVAGASWTLSAGNGTLHNGTVRISYPGIAQATTAVATVASMTNPQVAGTANGVVTKALSHRLSTAYDGFTLTFTGGTFTGTVKVYGEHNN